MYRNFSLTLLLVLLCIQLSAKDSGLQPYIGIHGGVNFTNVHVIQEFGIITLISGDELPGREYKPLFQNFGSQFGLSFFLEFNKHLALGFWPEFANYKYNYSSEIEYTDRLGEPASTSQNEGRVKLSYLNFPLVLQYTILDKPFSPYVFAGGAYGLRQSSLHTVNTTDTQITASGEFPFSTSYESVNVGFIRSKFSLLGGVGARYDFTGIKVALDFGYWLGMNNITDETNRYSDGEITGHTYEIPDDIKLDHLAVNLRLIFIVNTDEETKGALDCIKFNFKRKKP